MTRNKLTKDQVVKILERRSAGETLYSIAEDFPVSHMQIYRICIGECWFKVWWEFRKNKGFISTRMGNEKFRYLKNKTNT